jgi:hypothetical protein
MWFFNPDLTIGHQNIRGTRIPPKGDNGLSAPFFSKAKFTVDKGLSLGHSTFESTMFNL